MPDAMSENMIDPTLPEVVQNFLRSGARLESIHLDARGTWTHEGMLFENPRVIALFNRSVNRTPGGTWVLEIPPFTYPITVEDTGFFVENIDLTTSPPTLTLSDETTEPLDIQSLQYQPEDRLYCTIKNGQFQARFKRHPYHTLLDLAVETPGGIALTIDAHTIQLLP